MASHKWNEWISELEDINKRFGMNGWSFMASVLFPTCGLITLLYCCFPPERKHCLSWYPGCYGNYQEALRNWQEKVGKSIMLGVEIFVVLVYFFDQGETVFSSRRISGIVNYRCNEEELLHFPEFLESP